jgi:hypothetical protein
MGLFKGDERLIAGEDSIDLIRDCDCISPIDRAIGGVAFRMGDRCLSELRLQGS